MGYPYQNRPFNIYLIILPFIALFAFGFYQSMNRVEMPIPELSMKLDSQDILAEHQPGVFDKHNLNANVNFTKGQKIIIDQTGVVFKGVSQGKVLLDLYLLKMDPSACYPLNFSIDALKQGIWLDNIQYRLISLKKNSLLLKIMDAY